MYVDVVEERVERQWKRRYWWQLWKGGRVQLLKIVRGCEYQKKCGLRGGYGGGGGWICGCSQAKVKDMKGSVSGDSDNGGGSEGGGSKVVVMRR